MKKNLVLLIVLFVIGTNIFAQDCTTLKRDLMQRLKNYPAYTNPQSMVRLLQSGESVAYLYCTVDGRSYPVSVFRNLNECNNNKPQNVSRNLGLGITQTINYRCISCAGTGTNASTGQSSSYRPSSGSSSTGSSWHTARRNSSGESWNDVWKDIGRDVAGQVGTALGELAGDYLRQLILGSNNNTPAAPVYSFNGKYYSSPQERDEAIEEYNEEQAEIARQKELARIAKEQKFQDDKQAGFSQLIGAKQSSATSLKMSGMQTSDNSLELIGMNNEPDNGLEIIGGNLLGTNSFAQGGVIIDPNASVKPSSEAEAQWKSDRDMQKTSLLLEQAQLAQEREEEAQRYERETPWYDKAIDRFENKQVAITDIYTLTEIASAYTAKGTVVAWNKGQKIAGDAVAGIPEFLSDQKVKERNEMLRQMASSALSWASEKRIGKDEVEWAEGAGKGFKGMYTLFSTAEGQKTLVNRDNPQNDEKVMQTVHGMFKAETDNEIKWIDKQTVIPIAKVSKVLNPYSGVDMDKVTEEGTDYLKNTVATKAIRGLPNSAGKQAIAYIHGVMTVGNDTFTGMEAHIYEKNTRVK